MNGGLEGGDDLLELREGLKLPQLPLLLRSGASTAKGAALIWYCSPRPSNYPQLESYSTYLVVLRI